MTPIDDLLENNRAYSASFAKDGLPRRPARKLAVVACMDARLDPARVLGLQEGDAHVIRNAGGVVTEGELRDLAISQHLLGTEEIILIQHTDCGMLGLDVERFRSQVEQTSGERPTWHVHAFDDLDENVRESLRLIRTSPFLPHRNVRGFVYEVETGELREVD